MAENKYSKLASNTIIFALGSFSSKVLSFLLMPYVTAKMVTADYSTADLIQQTANVLIPIVFLQVNSAVLRFALDEDSDKKNIFSVGLRLTAQGFLLFLIFYYPMTLVRINDMQLGDYTWLIYLFILVSGTRQLCQQFVRGCEHVRLFAVDGIIATATTLLFNLIFLGPLHLGVYGYILAIIASDFCSIVFLFVSDKLWKNVTFKKIPKSTRTSMLKYCIPMMPSIILWWVINVSDRYMVTGFVGSAENGLYTAASKIPNFVIMFSSIFIDAWQLSAVDEFDSEGKAEFFSKVFRVYSGGVFVASSGLILMCQPITKILVADSYYSSWSYVPLLIIATTVSCFVNFLASVYMASKKTVMGMVTALAGAVTNIVLNLILIPKIGAKGAAIATVAALLVVFISRAINTKQYVKINFHTPIIICELAILIAQCVTLLVLQKGVVMYAVEAGLVVAMLLLNYKPVKELMSLLLAKVLKKKKA